MAMAERQCIKEVEGEALVVEDMEAVFQEEE
jgi:hypothetical protein